jgi:hypothetical protein
MGFKENPVAVAIPRTIRTARERHAWLHAARGARQGAAMIRGFATKNTRALYEGWARRLEHEASEILERVRLSPAGPTRAPSAFRGGPFVPVVEKESP